MVRCCNPVTPATTPRGRVWNGAIDRKPALIARCAGPADVLAAVNFARANQLLVSVRGGGHNVTGNAVCDGGPDDRPVADEGHPRRPARRTVTAQAGVTWGELDHETQAFGLATTGGQISTTGIAGLTLGGGLGWLMRKCGLVVDNLLSADVVTADGRLLTASATENADLFWGLRGGGGNLGLVTSFEYRLHPIGPDRDGRGHPAPGRARRRSPALLPRVHGQGRGRRDGGVRLPVGAARTVRARPSARRARGRLCPLSRRLARGGPAGGGAAARVRTAAGGRDGADAVHGRPEDDGRGHALRPPRLPALRSPDGGWTTT